MTIQATALAKAIGLLKISGVPYAVIDHDENLHTTDGYVFHKIPEPKVKVPGDRKFTVPSGSYSRVYIPLVKDMKSGDVVTIAIPDPTWQVGWFQASLGSWANTHWGAGTYMTESDQEARTITIARIV